MAWWLVGDELLDLVREPLFAGEDGAARWPARALRGGARSLREPSHDRRAGADQQIVQLCCAEGVAGVINERGREDPCVRDRGHVRGDADTRRARHKPDALPVGDRNEGFLGVEEVRADPECDHASRGDKGQQGGGHRRQRAAHQRARRDAEREREAGIANRDDPARGEHTRRKTVHVDGIERRKPPADQPARQAGDDERGHADERDPDRQPAATRHALRPREPVGPALELARDERRAPEHPEQRRDREQRRAEDVRQRCVVATQRRAVAARRAVRAAQRVIDMA